MHAAHELLGGWESFYVIVGSSAAALTGLQFVVMALVAESTARSSEGTFGAFATPTVVHFSGVLFMSAAISAPWPSLTGVAIVLMCGGLAGVGYSVLVMVRARRQGEYGMVKEDWAFHVVLPLIAYAALLGSGVDMLFHPVVALFLTAAVQLLILFVGIHNAWDTAEYVALQHFSSTASSVNDSSQNDG